MVRKEIWAHWLAYPCARSDWIDGLTQGKAQAAQAIWEQYYTRLVRLANHRLGHGRQRVIDPEDVVQTAVGSFCRGLRPGRFRR
jgi:DNA-directed RNA polymerase specialized sigma24 family protein